jgi:hypothetical protein
MVFLQLIRLHFVNLRRYQLTAKAIGMLPMQKIEELLSISYVSAVIAHAGFTPNSVAHDFGIDIGVHKLVAMPDNTLVDLGSVLNLQLKATINWTAESSNIVFDMEAGAYNKLIFSREYSSTPCVLVLCCLPKEHLDWINICEDQLAIRKCCYWHHLEGNSTSNTSSQRIRIPRNQILTSNALRDIVDSCYEAAK